MSWFWAFKKKCFFFLVILTGPLERLPTYLSHTRSGPNVVRKFFLKKEFLKKISFLKWSFFLGDCDRAFQKSYLCTSLIEDQVRTWFEKKFWKNLLFWNKVSFWVIVTEPLKSLATYLFHRGSSPNIIRKKKKKFWKNEILKILKWSFFLGDSDWAFKKATYIPLS